VPRNVDEARQALANRLRDLRKNARLSGRELAGQAGWHYTKVSKIEHGTTMPSEADLELWCFHTHSEAEYPDLAAMARGIERMYRELRKLFRSGTAHYQKTVLREEAEARLYRSFTVDILPGLLQTEAYAKLVLSRVSGLLGLPDTSAEAAAARMERARILADSRRLFHFVIYENAIRTVLAPPDIKVSQLRHLLGVATQPNVHLGVLPIRTAHYAIMNAFTMIDDKAVDVETHTAIIKAEQPAEIGLYGRIFAHYSKLALYGQQVRELIENEIQATVSNYLP
jgi:transcriptional regulator with XRE-family HTH domain